MMNNMASDKRREEMLFRVYRSITEAVLNSALHATTDEDGNMAAKLSELNQQVNWNKKKVYVCLKRKTKTKFFSVNKRANFCGRGLKKNIHPKITRV